MKASLVFPHQLFSPHPALKGSDLVLLWEHPLFFGNDDQYPLQMHSQKLVLHRASMKAYEVSLIKKGLKVSYIDAQKPGLDQMMAGLRKKGITQLVMVDAVDDVLMKRMRSLVDAAGVELVVLDSPGFLNSADDNQQFFSRQKKYFMKTFYEHQRKRLGVLVDQRGMPEGGQWSFDTENRKKLPKDKIPQLPELGSTSEQELVEVAKKYVKKMFPEAIGAADEFRYPVTSDEAKKWFRKFLKDRFEFFGPYEDAMVSGQSYLYHSVLTPALNIGLITPKEILEELLMFAELHSVPLPSLEGFIRQIIGWREFVRASYEGMGVKMRTANVYDHQRRLPKSFYDGSTGIDPLDEVIQRVLKTGYCHHIERLMVLGGFFFLCEIHPDEVYRWFMEMFVDSYDWVMVPNVYAMSQHSCGPLITTKPYFCGSNYLLKMSNFPKGPWTEVWDGLYWRFVWKHRKELAKNPRWSMMVRQLEKMPKPKLQGHVKAAEEFLAGLG